MGSGSKSGLISLARDTNKVLQEASCPCIWDGFGGSRVWHPSIWACDTTPCIKVRDFSYISDSCRRSEFNVYEWIDISACGEP